MRDLRGIWDDGRKSAGKTRIPFRIRGKLLHQVNECGIFKLYHLE